MSDDDRFFGRNEWYHAGFKIPPGDTPRKADTCAMYLRALSGERCRRSADREWYGYRVCRQCSIGLESEGYPENTP